MTILYVRSHLRLVVNLQTNVKAMQSPAYAHRVKLSNLQQMANTIIYVQEHGFDTQSDLKNTLLAAKQELKEFAQGDRLKKSPMHMSLLEAFEAMKKQRDSLSASIKQLKDMVKDLESKPKDSSYEDEIKELKAEQAALINVLKELNKKDVFNFLSDEGLLPNYAFPEAGIILKAVLYRKDEADAGEGEQRKNIESLFMNTAAALPQL